MKLFPFAFLMLCLGCAETPSTSNDAQTAQQEAEADTAAARIEQVHQDIEESGKELDKLINDL